ncbi:hypothetical protein EV385_6452 [Krasilnikovia cinnamomea]|uniref:Glycerophosphoryl diester phosphodiesterase family protein n=1 Tax=Krasilnikovia cinnamomea TaxID=349313 RepID=A0A4Q7ZUC0_9ACTN|nr:hypothetical protein [Krasilnikovia cinnamomea]RZU54501.1 hypothetical protein EV385_6452 [Krasilnikovia cinnamomea]
MSQPPESGPPHERPDEPPQPPAAAQQPFGGLPSFPGVGWDPARAAAGHGLPYGQPWFDPADPLVSDSYAGWWQRGFAVVRRGWRPLLLCQAIVAVAALVLLIPAQLFADLATARVIDDPARFDEQSFASLFIPMGVSTLGLLASYLVTSVGTLVTARLAVIVATGGVPRVGTALRGVLPRVPALIGWSLVAGLICLAALLACFVPILYVGAVFVLLPMVVLFEPGEGIGRCFRLFHTDIGVAVGRIATAVVLSFGVALPFVALSAVAAMLGSPGTVAGTGALIAGSVTSTVLSQLGSLVAGVVVTPLVVAAYADLRARREPFSTALLVA